MHIFQEIDWNNTIHNGIDLNPAFYEIYIRSLTIVFKIIYHINIMLKKLTAIGLVIN